jgi:hypothetical protein
MFLFTIVSGLLSLAGLATLLSGAWRHYKFAFFDCFCAFTRQLSIGAPNNKDNSKHFEYIQGDNEWNKAHTFSIKKYLDYTSESHRNNSEYYATCFEKMQTHKLKVFLSILVKMNFANLINIEGFEYDLHASRMGK